MVYMLFVDGLMVTEHTGQPPEEASTNITQSDAITSYDWLIDRSLYDH